MKYCPKCQQTKDDVDFGKAKERADGLRGWCKLCTNAATSQWQKNNPAKMRAKGKRFYENHKEAILEVSRVRVREWYGKNKEKALTSKKKWAANNRERVNESKRKWKLNNLDIVRASNKKYRAENKEQRLKYNREWRAMNIEKAREKSRRASAKRLNTPKGKLSSNVSREIRSSINGKAKGNRHWESLVDFTVAQLKVHLEKLFKPGMTWENYGTTWHIDHKIPIAAFNFERPDDIDFRLCWSLKNLQPLEASKNKSKGAKIESPFQPSLAIGVG